MRIVRYAVAIVAVAALAGCAVAPPTGPSVVVMPGKGKSFAAFRADNATCRQFAAQETGVPPATAASQSLVGSAAVGTALGAAAGAAIGAATGNPAAGAAIGAGSGLALGTASGASAAEYAGSSLQRRYDISYVQCMAAKGNQVPQIPPAETAYAAPAYAYPYPFYPYAYYSPYPAWYGPTFSFGWGDDWHHWRR